MFRDEDDDIALSTARALERADHGKKERKAERMQREEKKELLKLQRQMLLKNVKDKQIPVKHEERGAFGQKTHEQKVEEQKAGDAQKTATPDQLIRQKEDEARVQREAKKVEEQKQPD
ncbi:hypothetical protein HY213_02530 [Candidatus Peregrinibacteria bacterium]|nr:hypothetical protein [Candidatus Peregrinibacteria bacterium]